MTQATETNTTPAGGADAELLAIIAAFDALERQKNGLYATEGETPMRDEMIAELDDQQDPLLDRICTLPAVTPEGFKARAASLLLWDRAIPKEGRPGGYYSGRMIFALIRDLVGPAAVAQAMAPTAAADNIVPLASIFDLGRAARVCYQHYADADEQLTGIDNPIRRAAIKRVKNLADARREALIDLASTLPAHTLRDAAVQAVIAYNVISYADACEKTPRLFDETTTKLMRLLCSIVPVIAREAGVELADIGDDTTAEYCAREIHVEASA